MKPFALTAVASSLLALGTSLHAHVDHDGGGAGVDAAFEIARVAAESDPGWFRDAPSGPAPLGASPRAAARGTEVARLGAWSAVEEWPVLPVHAALLPNGKVLAWDATPDDFGEDVHTADRYETRVTVWDPATNTHLRANNDTDTDLFCAGSAHLWDGRVLFAGGDGGRDGKNGPLSNSNLYDPWSNTWSRTDDLLAPRWYSSVAALGTGEMLTFGGAYVPTPVAEVFGFDKRWRGLPIRTQYSFSGDYSWLQATTDGDVMYFGPHDTLSRLDTTGAGTWTAGRKRDEAGYRGYGSYAMYDIERVLVAGGGESLASAVVVDTTDATATPTSPMAHGRRQHNLTVLADGSVLATGGNRTGANFIDLAGGVTEPERWDPASGRWTTLAPATVDRQYHSIALLLADGRVLAGGGGYCPLCSELGYHEQNVEIFSPPYLFAADGSMAVRPRIGSVPAVADYAERFVVPTPDAASIRRAHLIRPGSVTHSQNHEQRLVPLEFASLGDRLVLTAPADRDVAPPGHYLLFLVDANGTPSVGEMLQIGQPLIRSAEVVRSRSQENRPDYFAIEGRGMHRLSVSLSRADRELALFVGAGRMPAADAADRSGFSSCLVASDDDVRRCDVSAPGDTTWYIGVKGAGGTEYALVAHLGDMETTPAPANELATLDASSRVGGLVASGVTERTATLAWQAPAGIADIDGYEIRRDGALVAYERSRTWHEPSLSPRTTYRYQVVAVGADLVRGLPSRTLAVTTEASTENYEERYSPYIPTRPTGLRHVRYSSGAAELFWESSFDNGSVVAYEVWRDGEYRGTSGGLSFFDDTLEADTDHSWYVVAVDDLGNRSAPSAPTGTAMPDPVDPVRPVDPSGAPDPFDPSPRPDPDDVDPPSDGAPEPGAPGDDGGSVEPDEREGKVVTSRRGGGGAAGFALLLALGIVAVSRRRLRPEAGDARAALAIGSLALLLSACSDNDGADAPLDPSNPNAGNSLVVESPFAEPRPEAVADPAPSPSAPSGSGDAPTTSGGDPATDPPVTVPSPTTFEPSAPPVAMPPTTLEPGTSSETFPPTTSGPDIPADAPRYVGRPWQSTAGLGQDALDALGLHAMRRRVEDAARALGLHDADAVDSECPDGGSARATSAVTPRREERTHEFTACALADGSTLDGVYDVVRRDEGSDASEKRELEEFYAITSSSPAHRLEVGGTLTEAVNGSRADACDLVRRETVLRIDVPAMVVGDVEVRRLAVEDITNLRIVPADDGVSCGSQVTELAFSDSARVTDRTGGEAFEIGINRTGSILRDESGRTSSSGSDLRIRIYHPGDDASLDLSPRFGTPDGAAVAIDDHPGRIDFDAVWRFLRER